jgi:hypothetical protein
VGREQRRLRHRAGRHRPARPDRGTGRPDRRPDPGQPGLDAALAAGSPRWLC